MVQAERFVSHLPLYRPQKRANDIYPYAIVLICNIATLVRGVSLFIYRNDCFTGTHIDISKLAYNVSELRPFHQKIRSRYPRGGFSSAQFKFCLTTCFTISDEV